MGTEWPAFESWLIQRGKSLYSGGKVAFTANDVEQFWNFTTAMRKSRAATSAQVTATVDGIPSDEPLLKHAAAGMGLQTACSRATPRARRTSSPW